MFGIFKKSKGKSKDGKKEKSPEQKENEEYNKKIEKEVAIHTLPKKFYFKKIGTKKSKMGLFLVLGGILLVLAVLGGSYFYLFYFQNKTSDNKLEEEIVSDSPEEKELKFELFAKGLVNGLIPRGEEIAIGVKLTGDGEDSLKSVDFVIPDDFISANREPFSIKVTVSEDYNSDVYDVSAYGSLNSGGDDLRVKKEFAMSPQKEVEDEDDEIVTDEEIEEEPEISEKEEENVNKSDFLIDEDNDGLLRIEEVLFGTSDSNDDTDGDTYEDGKEILNLYDPNGPGKLEENINIVELSNKMFSYKVLSVKDWPQKSIGGDDSWIIKQSDEHFMQIAVQQNLDNQTIENWYLEQFEDEVVEEVRKIKSITWSGIVARSGTSIYITDNEKKNIFVISYNFKEGEAIYNSVFGMMVESFEIIK